MLHKVGGIPVYSSVATDAEYVDRFTSDDESLYDVGTEGENLTLAKVFTFFTRVCPWCFLAVFDQDVSSLSASKFPYLYELGQKNVLLARRVFLNITVCEKRCLLAITSETTFLDTLR
ncbi:hypothetical protein PsorP6_015228 [Peronosclerospora sorghi]|uniref:Uncharacterized protein n=1 Tax=Peronosclerospora sorghi TaxID=230839 RepID=A0ACC0VUB4_9STRA|nr:hypothetical protein PsorP6_015228 [Peronosclerospora sorghi]